MPVVLVTQEVEVWGSPEPRIPRSALTSKTPFTAASGCLFYLPIMFV